MVEVNVFKSVIDFLPRIRNVAKAVVVLTDEELDALFVVVVVGLVVDFVGVLLKKKGARGAVGKELIKNAGLFVDVDDFGTEFAVVEVQTWRVVDDGNQVGLRAGFSVEGAASGTLMAL